MSRPSITIELSRAEALVLFEWLSRRETERTQTDDDSAEQQVLWRIETQLEKTLAEVLAPNYKDLIQEARATVKRQS